MHGPERWVVLDLLQARSGIASTSARWGLSDESQLAGRVVEAALEAEMTEHLGHPLGGVPQGANVANGHTPKTVQTELGPVQVKIPCDRQGSFAPQVLPKRVTRLAGLDDKVLGLWAGGMTSRGPLGA
jgi:putative transposase